MRAEDSFSLLPLQRGKSVGPSARCGDPSFHSGDVRDP